MKKLTAFSLMAVALTALSVQMQGVAREDRSTNQPVSTQLAQDPYPSCDRPGCDSK